MFLKPRKHTFKDVFALLCEAVLIPHSSLQSTAGPLHFQHKHYIPI